MKRSDVRVILEREGIRDDVYSLEGGCAEEQLCLDFLGDSWVVYYSERGERNDLHEFGSEDEACGYLLETLRKDPTVRVDYVPPVVPPWDDP